MVELFCILFGMILGGGGMYLLRRGKSTVQNQTTGQDYEQYYELWGKAVNLLGANNQLTPEQIESITPKAAQAPAAQAPKLRRMDGISSHRRDVEVARAQKGLPPVDNLKGMISSHVRDVERARIEYGTTQ